jgi:hypothetical protein
MELSDIAQIGRLYQSKRGDIMKRNYEKPELVTMALDLGVYGDYHDDGGGGGGGSVYEGGQGGNQNGGGWGWGWWN